MRFFFCSDIKPYNMYKISQDNYSSRCLPVYVQTVVYARCVLELKHIR